MLVKCGEIGPVRKEIDVPISVPTTVPDVWPDNPDSPDVPSAPVPDKEPVPV